jgi:hypothetical protein
MHTLIESDLEQILRVHLCWIVFDDHQMRFFVMVRHRHNALACSYNTRYFHAAIVGF